MHTRLRGGMPAGVRGHDPTITVSLYMTKPSHFPVQLQLHRVTLYYTTELAMCVQDGECMRFVPQ